MAWNCFPSLKKKGCFSFKVFPLFIPILIAVICCTNREFESQLIHAFDAKISKLKLPDGFQAEHLYSPSENGQGSWVSMTFDDKGRLIASDQYGDLYRLELPPIGDSTGPTVQKLIIGEQYTGDSASKVQMGYAHGLLYAFNSLYVVVNNTENGDFQRSSGLYRLEDADGDDDFDQVTLLKELKGRGEHGPHSVKLSPDGKSLYVIAGNHTDMPVMDAYRLPPNWQEDNILPFSNNAGNDGRGRSAPGGWIAKVDPSLNRWELISAGFRNPFDIAFDERGELFAYDSDMELDLGMPWYRPTRVCHVTSGGEFGWRSGNSKWSPDFPDNLPSLINIGQGSPTNLVHGRESAFPDNYKKSLFAFDWSFGIIYAIQLRPEGSSYSAKAEQFISGEPLPLTDGTFGPDGALYFLTGGRRLDSDLYRVSYVGDEKNKRETLAANRTAISEVNAETILRRKLERYHGKTEKGAVNIIWPNLKNEDRFVRYAARIALEHQPVSRWRQRALNERDPQILVQSMIAMARQGKKELKNPMLKALTTIDYDRLSQAQQIDLLRAFELVFARFGTPEGEIASRVASYLNPHYPANTNAINRSLSKLLLHIEAPEAVEKTIALLERAKDDEAEKTVIASSDLILRNPQYGLDIARMLTNVPPTQQTYYATVLSAAKIGWKPSLHEKYFAWFNKAFSYKGGLSYVGFVNKARRSALKNVPKNRFDYYSKISGEDLLDKSGNHLVNMPSPKGPGRNWTTEEAQRVIDESLVNRNFEQGKLMFAATRCISCHIMRGEGGHVGPDLTQLGNRFSMNDMLEHIIDPNKEVSDQYAATVFTMKDGNTVLGRLRDQDNQHYYISQNPFEPEVMREIPKKDVVNVKYSRISLMMPGLINSLNAEELRDLFAYLKAGGNKDHQIYTAR